MTAADNRGKSRKVREQRMCPNADCEKYQQPTGVMGGCDCGTPLVPYYVAPTDEQLESYARVILAGQAARLGMSDVSIEYAVMLTMRDPEKKAWMLAHHRKLQDSASHYRSKAA